MKLTKKLSLNKETLVSLSTSETNQILAGMTPIGGSRFQCETCGYVCGDCVSATIIIKADKL